MQPSSILIIEDDKDIRETLQQVLEFEGYPSIGFSNGKEGLLYLQKSLASERPGLILLDLMMPIMNGWQFAEAASGDPIISKIPVVVVSAFGDKRESIRAQGFLKKPVDLEALMSFVRKYCGESSPKE